MKLLRRLGENLDTLLCILAAEALMLTPIVVDPRLLNSFVFPKLLVTALTVLIAVSLWCVHFISTGKTKLLYSQLDKAIAGFAGAALIAGIFSKTPFDSLVGNGSFFSLSFAALLVLLATYFVVLNVAHSESRLNMLADAQIAGGIISGILFLIRPLTGLNVFANWSTSVYNTVDSMNGVFGVWMVIMALVAMGQLLSKRTTLVRTISHGAGLLVALLVLLVINFNTLWILFAIGLAALIVSGYMFLLRVRPLVLTGVFAALIAVGMCLFIGFPRVGSTALPVEVALNGRTSWDIVSGSLFSSVKNAVIGTGHGTFGITFSQFRNPSFNMDLYVAAVRFKQPFNTVLALLNDGGILLLGAWLFVVLSVCGHYGVQAVRAYRAHQSRAETKSEWTMLEVSMWFVPWFVLTVAAFFFAFGYVLWWTWWVLLGLVMASMSLAGVTLVKNKSLTLSDSPQVKINVSFGFVTLVTLGVVALVGGFRWYAAELHYVRALKTNTISQVKEELLRAIEKNNHIPMYHVSLAQALLLEFAKQVEDQAPAETLQKTLEQTVTAATAGAQKGKNQVEVWENIALVYNGLTAALPEAQAFEKEALLKASELEPTNPSFQWRLGNLEVQAGKSEEALKLFDKALTLKKDYVPAYIGMASAYEAQQNFDKAVENYQTILPVSTDNIDVLFNYARVLFNRNKDTDRKTAEEIWQAIIKVQPENANVLYSLGMYYESVGDTTKALEYYTKVSVLNPENKDIKNKIDGLKN